ncbi:substrate-binding periplasmic protein [Spartinivicinus ruber]|uniref:substrate-binding periplasmic protein n=1 Tax=Spartinivicinus ruber TaxID=2683272 RepID=UPI001E4A5CDB|nr:transporter substrate-binding domain-containing protein [Spartinivicinus ruber]
MADRLNSIFSKAGMQVTYPWFDSWKAAYNNTLAGKVTASPGWICNQKRSEYFYFSYPVYIIETVLFHLKSNPIEWESWEDLKEIGPIAITESYYFGNEFEEAVKKYKLQLRQVRLEKLAFNLLLKDRVAVVPMPLDNGLLILNKYYTEEERNKIIYHPKKVGRDYLHIMISKQAPGAISLYHKINKELINSSDTQGRFIGSQMKVLEICSGVSQPDWHVK